MLLLAALGACGRRQGGSPAVAPAATPEVAPAVDAPAPAAEVRPAPADASTEAPVEAGGRNPDAALLAGLADGSVDLAAHVDPARGVVLVTYVEAAPSGLAPARRENRRVCAPAAARDAALRGRLRAAAARATEGGDGFACDGDECVAHGMEYQPAYRMRLGRAPDGTRVLLAATEVSEAAMDPAWTARARAFVDRSLGAAAARPCPTR